MEPSAKRIGLLGGTFNPPHLAHVLLAQEAWHQLDLEQVLFVPALENPLKADPDAPATISSRLAMVKLAVRDDHRFVVDDCEIKRGRPSYTIDTLMHFQERDPDTELFLLMGADAAVTLPEWKNVRMYAGLCSVVICNRPGEQDLSRELPDMLTELGLRYEYLPLPPLDVSSTEIRRRVSLGKPIRYFVTDSVAEYIHQHGLYK